jgi:hypothetical protein
MLTLPTATRTLPTERAVIWVQVVASKSGGEPHVVRCFSSGLLTCDCKGFEFSKQRPQTCSHLQIAKLREAREALAQAALKPAHKAEQAPVAEPVTFICDEPTAPTFHPGASVVWTRNYRHKPAEQYPATVIRVDGADVVIRAQDGERGPQREWLVKLSSIAPQQGERIAA